jgi:diketogulonate reductase-like aldo/keto reductase
LQAFAYLLELQSEGLIKELGLCNFDAQRTDEICTFVKDYAKSNNRGNYDMRPIVSNQVQVSL